MSEEEGPKARLDEIARVLLAGETPPPTTVRAFLGWFFGAQRRGRWTVSFIRDSLRVAGLRTEPDFESAHLDAPMRLLLVDRVTDALTETRVVEVADTIAVTVSDDAQVQITRS